MGINLKPLQGLDTPEINVDVRARGQNQITKTK